jgi:hypothetical protein
MVYSSRNLTERNRFHPYSRGENENANRKRNTELSTIRSPNERINFPHSKNESQVTSSDDDFYLFYPFPPLRNCFLEKPSILNSDLVDSRNKEETEDEKSRFSEKQKNEVENEKENENGEEEEEKNTEFGIIPFSFVLPIQEEHSPPKPKLNEASYLLQLETPTNSFFLFEPN